MSTSRSNVIKRKDTSNEVGILLYKKQSHNLHVYVVIHIYVHFDHVHVCLEYLPIGKSIRTLT